MANNSFIYDPVKKEFRAPSNGEFGSPSGTPAPGGAIPDGPTVPWADSGHKRSPSQSRSDNNVAVFWILAIALAITWVLIAWIAHIHRPMEEGDKLPPPAQPQMTPEKSLQPPKKL